jgi:phosphoglycerate dehydrogenase-like enzyme
MDPDTTGPARIGVIVHRSLCRSLFSEADAARLSRLADVSWTESELPIDTSQAIEVLGGADVAIGSWKTPLPDERLLAACPRLRLWVHAAGSVKMMFGPQLRGRGLVVASCAPAIAEQVGEFTLGLIIVGLKRLIPNAAANRAGPAPKPANALTPMNATVGVIGASHVGRRVMQLLRPMGSRIVLFDPYVTDEQARELGATKAADLVSLCASSDLVTLHAPLLPSTRRMLSADQFRAMRDDCVFINTARGGCVDEPALLAELERGRLFAFLDVTDPEPAPADSPLRRLPNVVLTSHIAGMAEYRIGRQAVDDVEAFLQGRAPKLVVTEDMLDRMA